MKERSGETVSETKINLFIIISILIFIALFFTFASMISSYGYKANRYAAAIQSSVTADEKKLTIIIDAGHGGEDPGAVANGLREKELNLKVAKKLCDFMTLSGNNVIMTRSEDVLLYKDGEKAKMKQYDLKNRTALIESTENAVALSIHMNKFSVQSCKGMQVFYSDNNPESKTLAESIQSEVKQLQTYNNREAKDEKSTIYLLEHSTKPAVLIECGFLSNAEESKLLSDDEYQSKLAFLIYIGFMKWLSSVE